MAEIITTAPSGAPLTYEVKELYLNWDGKLVRTVLLRSDGARQAFEFTGSIAVGLMTTLNTANLSVISLHKRILTYLLNNGYLAGTVSGIPV